jgi:hypothetical protein
MQVPVGVVVDVVVVDVDVVVSSKVMSDTCSTDACNLACGAVLKQLGSATALSITQLSS